MDGKIRAGEAFETIRRSDLITAAAWGRASARLKAFAIVARELAKMHADAAFQASEECRDAVAAIETKWEAEFGVAYPRNHEDVIRLAVRAGMTPEKALAADFTAADIFPIIEGYLDGLKDKTIGGSGGQAAPPEDGMLTVEEVCQLVGWQGENCKTFRNKNDKPELTGNAAKFSVWREWLKRHQRAFSQFPDSYSECMRRLSSTAV